MIPFSVSEEANQGTISSRLEPFLMTSLWIDFNGRLLNDKMQCIGDELRR